jgi:hypothetical protein
MTLDLTPAQFQTLLGLIDQAFRAIGIRAHEDDVVSLMAAIKAAAQEQAAPDRKSTRLNSSHRLTPS